MRSDLFPVRLAGAGSGDSRTSGHLDQPPLSRLTVGRNWREKCVSPDRTCLSGVITSPDQAATKHTWPGCKACFVKLGENQLSVRSLSCAALVTPQQSCVGTGLTHCWTTITILSEIEKKRADFLFSKKLIIFLFQLTHLSTQLI